MVIIGKKKIMGNKIILEDIENRVNHKQHYFCFYRKAASGGCWMVKYFSFLGWPESRASLALLKRVVAGERSVWHSQVNVPIHSNSDYLPWGRRVSLLVSIRKQLGGKITYICPPTNLASEQWNAKWDFGGYGLRACRISEIISIIPSEECKRL